MPQALTDEEIDEILALQVWGLHPRHAFLNKQIHPAWSTYTSLTLGDTLWQEAVYDVGELAPAPDANHLIDKA